MSMAPVVGNAVIAVRRVTRWLLLFGVPFAAILVGLYVYAHGGRYEETENAYVKADIIAVSAEVSGRVVEVAARDNEPVAAGAPLFRLDAKPFEIELARARAQMDVVRTEVQALRAEFRETLLESTEARERIDFLTRQLERQERLKEKGMSRIEAYDEARHHLEVARARLASVEERINRVRASLAGDPQLPAERHPRYVEAKTAYDAAAIDLARTQIKAPAAGVVSNMKLQPGEHVEKGAPIFSLIRSGEVWIEANFKETQLTHMREGQPASVVADAYPDHEWRALVAAIAPATGAEFAVLPPQNATGNWVKVVQRIPVLIRVEASTGQPPLRAGMTVAVAVDIGRSRGLPRVVQRLIDKGYLPRFLEPAPALAHSE
ncbi:MAG TPA: HlyD family secretion protein [Burkholderiales bacterium]|nr:HlyD family secretion protein [Burkholderiales bacterium]